MDFKILRESKDEIQIQSDNFRVEKTIENGEIEYFLTNDLITEDGMIINGGRIEFKETDIDELISLLNHVKRIKLK